MDNKERLRRESIEKYGGVMKFWTVEEIERLRQLFPITKTQELCDIFKRSKVSIYNKAKRLGLIKTDEFLREACGFGYETYMQMTDKNKGDGHWNYGNKRPNETIEKIKQQHFELSIKHQEKLKRTYKVGGQGEREFAQHLDRLNIPYQHQKLLLGKYIVDFLIPSLSLVIEIDDPRHKWGRYKKKDEIRDAELRSNGYSIVRIPKKEVRLIV